MVTGALDAARAAAEAQSPSKATMRLGRDLALGLAQGLKAGSARAMAAAAEMSQNVLTILESALGIGDAVTAIGDGGLPTAKLAKAMAKKAAYLVHVMSDAMLSELKKLNLGKKGANADRLSAASGMAGDMASIFSAFTELTPESVTKAVDGINAAKSQAKVIAAAMASMVKDFRAELTKKISVSEGETGTADRATGIAGSIASILATFVDVTADTVTSWQAPSREWCATSAP
jgi:hypothetical protein